MRLLLLHPPLLAPVVLSRLSPLLGAAGHEVVVPDLRGALTAAPADTWWERAVEVAATSMPDAQVVVAHSGAGALVPPLAHRLPRLVAVVLVDAVLPPADGVHTTSPQVRTTVADLAVDGVLPPWTSWWPEGEMETQVPHDGDRGALVDATPALPEALYDVDVPAHHGWEPVSRSYVRLSPAYEVEAQQAGDRGWHVERHEGSHLDLLARPAEVAATIAALLPATTRPRSAETQREVFARAKRRGGSLSLTDAVEAVHAGRRET